MRSDGIEYVSVAFDSEIETPRTGYARLPEITSCVVFLRAQRRMPEVANQVPDLFVEAALNFWWSGTKESSKPI
jgi:hypothetical protein